MKNWLFSNTLFSHFWRNCFFYLSATCFTFALPAFTGFSAPFLQTNITQHTPTPRAHTIFSQKSSYFLQTIKKHPYVFLGLFSCIAGGALFYYLKPSLFNFFSKKIHSTLAFRPHQLLVIMKNTKKKNSSKTILKATL